MTTDKPRHDGEWVRVPRTYLRLVHDTLQDIDAYIIVPTFARDDWETAKEQTAALAASPATSALGTEEGEHTKLTEIRMLRAAITPGDWVQHGASNFDHCEVTFSRDRSGLTFGHAGIYGNDALANSKFIAKTPAAVDFLLSHIASQAQTIEALRADLAEATQLMKATADTYYLASGKVPIDGQDGYDPIRALRIFVERRALKEHPNG